ncbi:MAG: DUF305 domain-containing protein [Glaciimonas sp.]|nr:DUF305 domain-containing protein [Glaciimonas sp.]
MNYWPSAARRICGAVLAGICALTSAAALEIEALHQHDRSVDQAGMAPAPFVASTAKSFSALMSDAMAVMDYGMQHAPMGGTANNDFVLMMIPHHQGAIDMAKALLLYTRDPELQNLAQGIITEQQNEIQLMQAWLQRHQAAEAGKNQTFPTKPPH